MAPERSADIGPEGWEVDPEPDSTDSARIYPLLGDAGNRRVLTEWLGAHDTYEAVDADIPLSEAEVDVCIIDEGVFQEREADLSALKAEAEPVLLPVLLLLPENRTDLIGTDDGTLADNVFRARVDEIVSLPIRQAELEWRVRALLRLRRQSIASKRETEQLELFREAIESSGHAIYITDTDGIIRYVNDAFEVVTGYTAEEAIGESPRIFHSGEMSDEFYAELWETVLSGSVWTEEIVNRRADGELYTAEQTIAPVTDEGEIRAFVAVQTDITDRIERADALARRTHAIDEAPIGITITDPTRQDNPMIYANDAFLDMTGYDRDAVLGENCRFLQGPETDQDRVDRIRTAIDAEEPISIELRNYRRDGTEFWNHLEIAPVTDDAGTVTNYVGFQQDITDRKEREQQLSVLDRVLRHNLRNDLNVIQGQADTIQSVASGDVVESADRIVDVSEQLIGMAEKERTITELLLETPTRTEVEVGAVIEEVADTLRAARPDATISTDCPAGLTARATNRLSAAIEELVTNAIVHDDTDTPSVRISADEVDDGVRIAVADTGPPIPDMERTIVAGTEDQTPLYHASGLGLWLVSLVVARSGGTIAFEDNDPTGNVVTIELSG